MKEMAMPKMRELSGKAAIVGYGDAYADPEAAATPIALASTATINALADAGLRRDDIDGLFTGRTPFGDYRPQWNNIFAAHMKIFPRHASEITVHGAGVNTMIKHAVIAVLTGAADNVLCVQSDGGKAYSDLKSDIPNVDADPRFELPYGPTMASYYAMFARRYMHEYGVTERDLARVAASHQEWAAEHPNAERHWRGRLSVEDILASDMIAAPLRRLMCAPWRNAGTAGAFIVTTAERARALQQRPLYVLGVGESSTNEYVIDRMSLRDRPAFLGKLPNLTTTSAVEVGRQAFEMAGLQPSDMHVVESGSNFPHMSLMMLEDLGFTPKGEAAAFVNAGHADPGGKLPYNTNGGYLGFGQAGISCVMDSIIELIRQLRGEALGRQVPDAEVGMVHGMGGPLSCHAAAIFSVNPN
jgi:acetyl-CoA acetyltransferase